MIIKVETKDRKCKADKDCREVSEAPLMVLKGILDPVLVHLKGGAAEARVHMDKVEIVPEEMKALALHIHKEIKIELVVTMVPV